MTRLPLPQLAPFIRHASGSSLGRRSQESLGSDDAPRCAPMSLVLQQYTDSQYTLHLGFAAWRGESERARLALDLARAAVGRIRAGTLLFSWERGPLVDPSLTVPEPTAADLAAARVRHIREQLAPRAGVDRCDRRRRWRRAERCG